MLNNTYIKASNWIKEKTNDEQGEMASWMILGAALAGIALGLGELMKDDFEGLAGKVTTGP